MSEGNVRLVLASASPRRRLLFEQAGLSFEVKSVDVDEGQVRASSPGQLVMGRARLKAEATAAALDPGDTDVFVIGADTVVVLDGETLGKPVDEEDARRMLARLSDRSHHVMTGVAVRPMWGVAGHPLTVPKRQAQTSATRWQWVEGTLVGHATTEVTMGPLSSEVIARYVATGEPLDKAGAYGIQARGGLLVQRIEGDYFNVVGLPLGMLRDMLGTFGVELLQ